MRRRVSGLVTGLAAGVLTVAGVAVWGIPEAAGQQTLVEGDSVYAELGANLQILTGYVRLPDLDLPEEMAGLVPEDAGLGSAVGRLEWRGEFGDRVSLDVHNRLFWQTSSIPAELLTQGFEVTRGADRRLDTSWEILESDGATLVHDLDRLVLGVYTERFDLYLGRQAIRWGVAELFPVADRFAPLSPFELDTLQRRGVDAARVVAHVTPDVEVDLVVADRGPDEAISAAGRVEYFGASIDAYLGGGRFYDRASALGGISYLRGHWKTFAEVEGLWNLEEGEPDLPRVTVGVQRVAMRWTLGAEYHFNGLGYAREDYGEAVTAPEFQRGETYFLGQHYLGLTGFYGSDGGWGAGGGVMANVVDPSVVIFPAIQYELAEQMSVSAGAYLGFGEAPELDGLELRLNSEYGGQPDLVFVQMTVFF